MKVYKPSKKFNIYLHYTESERAAERRNPTGFAPFFEVRGDLFLADTYIRLRAHNGRDVDIAAVFANFNGTFFTVFKTPVGCLLFKSLNADDSFYIDEASSFNKLVKKYPQLGLREGKFCSEDSGGGIHYKKLILNS